MTITRWRLALISQIVGLVMISFVAIWEDIILRLEVLGLLFGIVLYTLLPFWFLECFLNKLSIFIKLCGDILSLRQKNNITIPSSYTSAKLQDIYIVILAIFDLLVLCFLMIITDGLRSPFSPLLLTIPAVVYLIDLPFKAQLSAVFPLTLIIVLFVACFPHHFSFKTSFSTVCFSVITIACLLVIFSQAWADFERKKV